MTGINLHSSKVSHRNLEQLELNDANLPQMTNTKQYRYDCAYMRMALEWSKLSHCTRKKVAALLVRDNVIISDGFNGTPSGFPNDCEDHSGDTHWYVLHAEANAIMKVARTANSAAGATLYITLSPCKECCKLVLQAGIKRLVYLHEYKDPTGILFLRDAGIEILKIDEGHL
jgi:dCMP deaminase